MRNVISVLLATICLLSSATLRASAPTALETLLKKAAPPLLSEALAAASPVVVTRDKRPLVFVDDSPGVLKNSSSDLTTEITYGYDEPYRAAWYQVRFTNRGKEPVRGLAIEPFSLRFHVDPPRTVPRIRYLTGSQHYDGVYPSRAFQVVDRAFMTNDHHKPVAISGGMSHDYVPMMEFAIQQGERLAGFMYSFEYSNGWSIEAGYTQTVFTGGPLSDFSLKGQIPLGNFEVRPGQTLAAPKIHLVFFEGDDWTPLENAARRYIADRIAYKKPPLAQVNKVTYDHWFGIHDGFNIDDMMRQAARAADLGCEYFCLDAGWYGKGAFGASGKGRWDEPDPVKFPGGVKDVQRLSQFCRDHGMGFGLWSFLIVKNGGDPVPFDLSKPEGVQGAIDTMNKWIDLYHLTWFRFEMAGAGDLQYMNGFYQVMETLTRQHPDFHVECCAGGGTRFDLGNMRYCTSTWLSDHTADADVGRFTQTGALRFWPSYMLNLAVRAHRRGGDKEATAYNFLSRAVGAPSFNGDIAQWSPEATKRMRGMVDAYKSVRHLQSQPVFFPLPQVRDTQEWDAVCFGDGTGEGQLLYAYRMFGAPRQFVKVPDASGEWKRVMASEGSAKIEPGEGGFWITLPMHGAACWKRSRDAVAASDKQVRTKSLDDTSSHITYTGRGWGAFDGLGATYYRGTAKSSFHANDSFEYTNPSCTRIKWFSTKSLNRGKAAVYIDKVLKATVDAYSPTPQATSALFDSQELSLGRHSLKIVVLHDKNPSSADYWVECDKIEVTTTEESPAPTALPAPTPIPGAVVDKDSALYFGKWQLETDQSGFHSNSYRFSNVQYNNCELKFRGPAVRWLGSKNKDHGLADVYLDGVLQTTVDSYNPTWISNVVLYEKTGLTAGKLHSLKIVVRKERNSAATDCCQDVDCFEVVEPVNYVQELAKAKNAEYAQIASGTKPFAPPNTWKPVAYAATSPTEGVTLQAGVLKVAFDRNIAYLNHCFASKTYCDGLGWSKWLPGSNEGRMLSGAGNSLRWGERSDMRRIVDTIMEKIKSRQRADGYSNYYPEAVSYVLGGDAERKNFDRVFWTRGLIDAGKAGNPYAYPVLRKFYDWFNACPYLGTMLVGSNATNGHPGGGLAYFTPVGTSRDLVTTERYFDEDYWIDALKNLEPLSISYYPGQHPHCYELLNIEAFLDEYRATGAQKYLDAARGAWKIYNENFEHPGGVAGICEGGLYPPKCFYLNGTGETCGSVFWVNINSRLIQLYPTEEKYAAEIEKQIYNVLLSCQDARGYIRYHNRLQGSKAGAGCQNTCCETSAVGLLGKLPQYIYSTDKDGLYVNLYAASTIDWGQGDGKVAVTQATSFPSSGDVTLTVATKTPKNLCVRVRVPAWAAGDMAINVNGAPALTGKPGTYAAIRRTWANGDTISFHLPMKWSAVKYEGLDQAADNVDRYALFYGPIVMALDDPGGRIKVEPANLPRLLTPIEGRPLHFRVEGTSYSLLPYWQVEQAFTCYPMVQP